MKRTIVGTVFCLYLIVVSGALAQQRRGKPPSPKPTQTGTKQVPPTKEEFRDPISGEWNALYRYQDLRIRFKLLLKLNAGVVTGEVTDERGSRKITQGSWSGDKLNLLIENSGDPNRPFQRNAILVENTLVGDFGPASDTTWRAERFSDQSRRVVTKQLPDIAAKLKVELEKLLSLSLSLQMEGAYNFGEMRAKAAPAIPFLIQVLRETGGLKEVDRESLRFLDDSGFALVSGEKVSTFYPVQNVAARALAKIGEAAIEPIRSSVLKDDPNDSSFSFGLDALARMQNPTATKLLHDMTRGDDVRLRRNVIESLANNKSPGTVELLIELLKDPDSVIRAEAADSLKKNTGKDFGQDSARWKEWLSNNKPKL